MLKPYVVAAAALSALVVPPLGAQLAVAAEPSVGLQAPAVTPSSTPAPVPPASESTEGDMAGMNHEGMPGMDHEQTSGMTDEEMPGMDHGGTEGHQGSSGSSATAAAGEGGESHGHGGETDTEPKPVAPLVGAFALVNGGVLVSAAVLRRRDKHRARSAPKPSRPAK